MLFSPVLQSFCMRLCPLRSFVQSCSFPRPSCDIFSSISGMSIMFAALQHSHTRSTRGQKVAHQHANPRSRIRPGVTVTAAYSSEASEVKDKNDSLKFLQARHLSQISGKLATMLTHRYHHTICAKLYPQSHCHSCVCLHKIFLKRFLSPQSQLEKASRLTDSEIH